MTSRPSDVVVVAGTRPEAIKLHGILKELGPRARLVHTGQHYDATMWENVLADLPSVTVAHHIAVGGQCRGAQIGAATKDLSNYLEIHPGRALVVQGDTNSTLAGALAANARGIPVVHIEAGLRSHDRSMPEEINRILVDAIADLCCAPTETNSAQLRSEGVAAERIAVTGNTLAEAIDVLLPDPDARAGILHSLGLASRDFVLATIHRASNVDDVDRLRSLLEGLSALGTHARVVLPLHPRTAAQVERAGLRHYLATLDVVEPLSPRQFIALEAEARLLLSDSGGVQEEACLLQTPLLVLRDTTERPELLQGWCRLLGDADPCEEITAAWRDSRQWLDELSSLTSPYPVHSASRAVVDEIDRRWPAAS